MRDHRAAAAAALQRAEADLAALRALRRGAADDDEHDPDGTPLSEEWSRLEGKRTAAIGRLAEIDAAIGRAATDAYGRCTVCGEPIDPRRLAIRPAAATCVGCAR